MRHYEKHYEKHYKKHYEKHTVSRFASNFVMQKENRSFDSVSNKKKINITPEDIAIIQIYLYYSL